MYEHIKVDTAGPIGRLCFQRPEKKNSMIPEMGDEILRAVEQLNANSQVRSIIVTGAGDVFSSGGDLDMIDELTEVDRADSSDVPVGSSKNCVCWPSRFSAGILPHSSS